MVIANPREAARVVAGKRASEISDALTGIRGAEQIRVAFLVNTTEIVEPHICAVRQQIYNRRGDALEDVNGGLRMALDRLDWEPLATKAIFHMGDALPH
ncbi:hypothetical protein PybrP1_002176 [[Pythium] brassicae (nom. inval.)]|nr:hypothetical protein PybrP1_002176 [[Pythium] brassicae (nom. inval.)]